MIVSPGHCRLASAYGVGAEVGPDLATIRNRTPDSLSDILIPSRSIAQMYEAYVVETIPGGTLEGVDIPPEQMADLIAYLKKPN